MHLTCNEDIGSSILSLGTNLCVRVMLMASGEYHREYNLARYYRKRLEYINLLGGKCVNCSSIDNLHFDHINPEEKSFSIGAHITSASDKVISELEKCQLLCYDCHKTKTEMNRDGYTKKARGEDVGISKLTKEKVREIRKLVGTNNDTKIAGIYGVSRVTIKHIRTGFTWKHVD